MIVLKERPAFKTEKFDIDAFTRKHLASAESGQLSLLDLEKANLSSREVNKFLLRKIPIMRAAAFGGKFETLGLFLEELYSELISKSELQAKSDSGPV
jgi:hypothetical protein